MPPGHWPSDDRLFSATVWVDGPHSPGLLVVAGHSADRVEVHPVNWPTDNEGVYLRGDQADELADALRAAAEHVRDRSL